MRGEKTVHAWELILRLVRVIVVVVVIVVREEKDGRLEVSNLWLIVYCRFVCN